MIRNNKLMKPIPELGVRTLSGWGHEVLQRIRMRSPGIVGGLGSGPLDGEPRPHPGLVFVLLRSKSRWKTQIFGICCILGYINTNRSYPGFQIKVRRLSFRIQIREYGSESIYRRLKWLMDPDPDPTPDLTSFFSDFKDNVLYKARKAFLLQFLWKDDSSR